MEPACSSVRSRRFARLGRRQDHLHRWEEQQVDVAFLLQSIFSSCALGRSWRLSRDGVAGRIPSVERWGGRQDPLYSKALVTKYPRSSLKGAMNLLILVESVGSTDALFNSLYGQTSHPLGPSRREEADDTRHEAQINLSKEMCASN